MFPALFALVLSLPQVQAASGPAQPATAQRQTPPVTVHTPASPLAAHAPVSPAGLQPAIPKTTPQYLVQIIDLRTLIPTTPVSEPCGNIEVAAVLKGQASPFTVTSSPGFRGTFTVTASSGSLTNVGGNNYQLTADKEGAITITLTAKPAAGVKLDCSSPVKEQVQAETTQTCVNLDRTLAPRGGSSSPVSAPAVLTSTTVTTLLPSSPPPLTVKSQGIDKLLVYSSTLTAAKYAAALQELKKEILMLPSALSGPTAAPMRHMEIDIPLSARDDSFANLNDAFFTATLSSPGKAVVTEKKNESCEVWVGRLREVGRQTYGTWAEPPVLKLFYLDSASDSAKSLSAAMAVPKSGTSNSGTAPASNANGTSAGNKPDGGSNANSNDNVADSSNTTGGTTAGSSGQSESNSSGSASANSADKSSIAGPQKNTVTSVKDSPAAAGTPAPAAKEPVSDFNVSPLEQDLLVLGGEPVKVRQAKRVLAMLDLPRPQMIVNSWILQASTNRPDDIGKFDDIVRRFAAQNNEALQASIEEGWLSLQKSMAAGNFFDDSFYHYLVDRYVGELDEAGENNSVLAPTNTADQGRRQLGICSSGQYCLGYISLFSPLKPRLMDLLLAMIAANAPAPVAMDAVSRAENGVGETSTCVDGDCKKLREQLSLCDVKSCNDSGSNEDAFQSAATCGRRDLEQLVNSSGAHAVAGYAPRLQLQCFLAAVNAMAMNPNNLRVPPAQAQARAALADFLFQYKMSQMYPNDFSPYDLTQSANALDVALNPFIDAFNRDVSAFQDYLNTVVHMAVTKAAQRGTTFTNSGLVSVRTVSGSQASVSSTTQSTLDTGTFPDLSTLAANIVGDQPVGGTGSNAPKTAGILNNLSYNEAQALMGALKSFQTTQAQIGRAIDVTVSPRALSGDSSAEMDITLKADESGTPSMFNSAGSQNFNFSRVATHDITTHVRVDSLRLFELSSVSATLTLSRPPVPIVPPFVELPYVGSLIGWPRKPAQEYHSSVAIMSAIVVPTATDLAYGLAFTADRVVTPIPPICRLPWENGDPTLRVCPVALLNAPPLGISSFHRAAVYCFATGMASSTITGSQDPPTLSSNLCNKPSAGEAATEF